MTFPLSVDAWGSAPDAPLFGVASTVFAYVAGIRLHRWSRGHPLLHPTLIGIILVTLVLEASRK